MSSSLSSKSDIKTIISFIDTIENTINNIDNINNINKIKRVDKTKHNIVNKHNIKHLTIRDNINDENNNIETLESLLSTYYDYE